jgi:two-component system LytT family response regulator
MRKYLLIPTFLLICSYFTSASCESDDNYTKLKLKDGEKLLITRSLKEIEESLEQHSFIRVHRSYLVNLNEIEKYIKGE